MSAGQNGTTSHMFAVPRSFHPEPSWMSLLPGCCWFVLSLPSVKTPGALQHSSSLARLFPAHIVSRAFSKKDFAFVLGEFYCVPVGPYLQPVQGTLDGSLLSALSAVHSILVCSENLRRLHSHFFKIMVLNRAGTRANSCSSTFFVTSRQSRNPLTPTC